MNIILCVGIGAIVLTIGLASAGLNQDNNTENISDEMQNANQYNENCRCNTTGNCSQHCYRYRTHNGNGVCNGPGNSLDHENQDVCSGIGGSSPRYRKGNGSGCCRQK